MGGMNGWIRLLFALSAGVTIVRFVKDLEKGHLRWN